MKVTKEMIDEMKRLRDKGLTYKQIGNRFSISETTVRYHLADRSEYRRRIKEYYWKHRDKMIKKNREYRKKNKDKFKRSVALSFIRHCLKNKIVKVEDLEEIIEELKPEYIEKANRIMKEKPRKISVKNLRKLMEVSK